MSVDKHVAKAAHVIVSGGVIAHPTEGVFGLACDPKSPGAIERILAIKARDRAKGLILLAHDVAALRPYCADLNPAMLDKIGRTHDYPTTFIVPAAATTSSALTGNRPTLAVRITTHAFSRALCAALNHPIVSTSANRGGNPPARDAAHLSKTLGDDLDLIVDGPLGDATGPSQIVDILTNRVFRPAAPVRRPNP